MKKTNLELATKWLATGTIAGLILTAPPASLFAEDTNEFSSEVSYHGVSFMHFQPAK